MAMLIIGRLPFIDTSQRGVVEACDILYVSVRRTVDNILVISKSPYVLGNKHQPRLKSISYENAQLLDPSLQTVESVLARHIGTIFLDLDVPELRSTSLVIALLEKKRFKKHLDNLMVSSRSGNVLLTFRRHFSALKLSMVTNFNPYLFIAWERLVGLSAVGFHRLHVTKAAVEAAQKIDLFTYAYTVDRQKAAELLADKGVEGIVTDSPEALVGKS